MGLGKQSGLLGGALRVGGRDISGGGWTEEESGFTESLSLSHTHTHTHTHLAGDPESPQVEGWHPSVNLV